ncbi:ABC transporter permease [Chitinasiproducens palmae]|uniref:Sulfonate transport system permease protein n=1 Tax=Chitinasiproducens palmae TaxID=1770053 RepID=A0A1H2PQ89_9BURK|nr:ABC transporter permease [Chitinasiproducens palmae]SDV48988.1 sulfonate transport system permease protein [Chitinasiproducens palmae]
MVAEMGARVQEPRTVTSRESACEACSAAKVRTRLRWWPRNRIAQWRLAGYLFPLGLLLLLEAAARSGLAPPNLLPAPSAVAGSLAELGATRLLRHVGASTSRVLGGFAIGAVLGIVLGGAMALSRKVEALLDPTFQALRAVPSLAWVPVLLLWLGIDEGPKIALTAIGAFFPVQLSVLAGIRGVDRKLVELGRVHRLSPLALFMRILLPAALPQVLTGLRTGLSLAWMFMVAAELIATTRGLGYLLSDGRETGRLDLVFGAIFLLAVLGKISDSVMKWLEQRLLAWRDETPASGRSQRTSPPNRRHSS